MAARAIATSSRSSPSSPAAASPSPTTATSPTRSPLQERLQRRGSIFQSTSDTEVILHLIATSRGVRLVDRMIDALSEIEGAWSLVCLSSKKMIGARDPHGVRPLVLGDLDGAPILASETCALDIIGARFVRDVEPGEMVIVTPERHREPSPLRAGEAAFLHLRIRLFLPAQFDRRRPRRPRGAEADRRRARPREAGRSPTSSCRCPTPARRRRSALPRQSGLPFDLGIIRNHYVGRTFIEPSDAIRDMGVKLKHNANRAVLAGKRVVLVDDSIVRGTTSLKIVKMVRDAGASEVHMRIASPPTTHSCFYGVDTPERSKLIASRMSVKEMAELHQGRQPRVPVDGRALPRGRRRQPRERRAGRFCDACFTGDYPIRLIDFERRRRSTTRSGSPARAPRIWSNSPASPRPDRGGVNVPGHSFTVVLDPQEEGGFTARVPALPEVVSEGDTEDEALANVEEAIRAVLDYRRDHGLAIPPDLPPEIRRVTVTA